MTIEELEKAIEDAKKAEIVAVMAAKNVKNRAFTAAENEYIKTNANFQVGDKIKLIGKSKTVFVVIDISAMTFGYTKSEILYTTDLKIKRADFHHNNAFRQYKSTTRKYVV